MDKFNARELPPIEIGSPSWQSIEAWAKWNLARLRESRENPKLEMRDLDQALGSITSLKALLSLPDLIKRERKRDPLPDDNFNIPAP